MLGALAAGASGRRLRRMTSQGETHEVAWRPSDGGKEHLAIVVGEIDPTEPVLVRLHSECFTGDLLASLRLQDEAPESVTVVGCVPLALGTGLMMSPEIEAVIPRMVAMIVEELARQGVTATPRS